MKKYIKFIVYILSFIIIIIAGLLGYNYLSKTYYPETSKQEIKSVNLNKEEEGKEMAEVHLTKENFEEEVLKSEKPVLVDFWADWCGPCKMLAPILSEVAAENQDKVKVGKVNVDEQSELASQYQIMSIPTLILFKNGEVVNTMVGVQPKEELESLINK